MVTLDGSNSLDADGAIASYRWTQTGGSPAAALSGATTAHATFTAPAVGVGGTALTFLLTVTDDGGLSASDTVIVNVSNLNLAPSAEAGATQTVTEGALVRLDGSNSLDADGAIASYRWTQTGGSPAAALSGAPTAHATFTAPAVGVGGTALTFLLTVTDDGGLSASDTVIVNVSDVDPPPAGSQFGVRFISASAVKVGYRTVTLDLPPAWAPGDVFVTMLFTPTGSPSMPSGWRHAQTYNWYKVAGSDESNPVITSPNGLVAGHIAAYRGADTRPGYMPGEFSLSAVPEYGGATSAPGTYYAPDGVPTPRFAGGVCSYSLGPALTPGSIAIGTYQSESSDSSPLDPHYTNLDSMTERLLSYAEMLDPDTGILCHFRLGFFDAPLEAGQTTGSLYWGTYGKGGGQRANGVPYTGPVSWISQLILNGAEDGGKIVAITPNPDFKTAGVGTLTGSRSEGSRIALTATTTAIFGDVSYPTDRTWACLVTATGQGTITAKGSDGEMDQIDYDATLSPPLRQ